MSNEMLGKMAFELSVNCLPCPICKKHIPLPQAAVYAHLLEHRVRFLEKVIRLYCDCDCDKGPKPGVEHWAFCRRKIGDEALAATLEQMVPETGK